MLPAVGKLLADQAEAVQIGLYGELLVLGLRLLRRSAFLRNRLVVAPILAPSQANALKKRTTRLVPNVLATVPFLVPAKLSVSTPLAEKIDNII